MTLPPDPVALHLAGLVASRICHDLISPIGAVGNGVELLAMAGSGSGPEAQLIADSAAQASARLRFLRLAFGSAGADARVGRAEVAGLLADVARGGRLAWDWQAGAEAPRPAVRRALLAGMCCEHALPAGGQIVIARDTGGWRVSGTGRRLRVEPALWDWLEGNAPEPDVAPGQVQFALLAADARAAGLALTVEMGEAGVAIGL